MSTKPRTIDNLGIESSVRYAKDMELLDTKLVEESRWIPQKTEVAVIKPYAPSEFDSRFSLGKSTLWASFSPPPSFQTQSSLLFSYQLIPSLGGYEKQEADGDKLEGIEDVLKKPFKRRQRDEEGSFSDSQKDSQQEEKERQILIALLRCISKLDRSLNLINGRRNQYQKG